MNLSGKQCVCVCVMRDIFSWRLLKRRRSCTRLRERKKGSPGRGLSWQAPRSKSFGRRWVSRGFNEFRELKRWHSLGEVEAIARQQTPGTISWCLFGSGPELLKCKSAGGLNKSK